MKNITDMMYRVYTPVGIYKYTLYIMSLTFFVHLPMKMEPIRSSETSAIKTQTPGNYPKRNILRRELFKKNRIDRHKEFFN